MQECNAKIIPLLEEKKKLKSILNYGNYDERYQNSGNRTIDSYFKRDKTKETNKSYDDNINDYGKKNSHWNMYLSDSENDSENEEENEVKGKEKIDSLNEGKKVIFLILIFYSKFNKSNGINQFFFFKKKNIYIYII